MLFCPPGSGYPTIVGFGNYTLGGSSTTQHSQAVCNRGYYCKEGVQYSCPQGTYGMVAGMNYITYPGENNQAHLLAGQQILARISNQTTTSKFPVDYIPDDKFTCSGIVLCLILFQDKCGLLISNFVVSYGFHRYL